MILKKLKHLIQQLEADTRAERGPAPGVPRAEGREAARPRPDPTSDIRQPLRF